MTPTDRRRHRPAASARSEPRDTRTAARLLSLAATLSLLLPASPLGPGPARAQEPDVPAEEAAQEAAGTGQALRVFIDCQTGFCDFDFFRREIPFVNYVRDRRDAEVHLLIISQETGGGGRSFTLDFIGRERFEGLEDRLVLAIRPNLAEEEALARLARTIKLGLIRYVARTPAAERIAITFQEGVGEEGVARSEDDPWNFWVFRTGLRGSFRGEDRQDFLFLSGSVSADRVTPNLKVELEVDGFYSEDNFETSDTTTVTSITRNYEFEGLIVWSLADRWSAGGLSEVEHSTFRNQEIAVRVAPALEWNLFPYDESERKQLSFLYSLGFNHFDWREETVFGKRSERRVDHALRVNLSVRQPWGEAGGSVRASHFLDDPGQNRLDANAGIRFRLFRGLSLDLSGSVSRVRDQINLPVGDATEEEILLQIRELQTGFEYGISFGFSYTFGSIFSNVVNPRF